MNFCHLMKKTGKQTNRIISKKLIFGQTYMKFDGCHGKAEMMDTQLTYQNFFLE